MADLPGSPQPDTPQRWYDPPEGVVSRLAGHAQMWLISKPWPLWRIGNLISDLRYRSWKRNGGTHGC